MTAAEPTDGHPVDDPASDGRRPHRPGRPPRRSWGRSAFYAGSLAVLVLAAGVAPLPFLRYVPGTPQELPDLIAIDGADTTEIEGRAALLTVLLDPVTPVEALTVLLDPATSLTPIGDVAPDGDLSPEFFDAQREQFARQFEIAAAVGADAAGMDVSMRTVPMVRAIVDDGPAAGVLRFGDVIRQVDGEPLTDANQLVAITQAADAGDELTLTVGRPDEDDDREVTVTLEVVPTTGDVGLGVVIETVSDGVDLPFDVTLGDTRIGGPSAGLMTALTVYDLLAEEDLLAGRTVVGTGTIGPSGMVGPVGGVAAKVRAAVAYDADVVLVPHMQLEEALATDPPDDLEVIGVVDLDGALEALRGGPTA